ncbi:sulfatase-like hydrolase/transferase [Paenibacillus sp. y28]|uniref:sulfatase-like hydrolase/transferase n=1 Tax=Paenibacillus sp. y28 TaxID=3129110 RepID=UPI003016DDDC
MTGPISRSYLCGDEAKPWPNDEERYGTADIQTEGPLTPDAKDTLETCTQGVRDADRSLQLLIDHFEQSGDPTVIVFFGDHLPMLGLNSDALPGYNADLKSEGSGADEAQS